MAESPVEGSPVALHHCRTEQCPHEGQLKRGEGIVCIPQCADHTGDRGDGGCPCRTQQTPGKHPGQSRKDHQDRDGGFCRDPLYRQTYRCREAEPDKQIANRSQQRQRDPNPPVPLGEWLVVAAQPPEQNEDKRSQQEPAQARDQSTCPGLMNAQRGRRGEQREDVFHLSQSGEER